MKTNLNWLFSISAFNLLSDSSLLLLFNVGILILSTCRLLMYDQNLFGESEQMDKMYLLGAFLVSVYICDFFLFGKHFVTCRVPALFIRVECSLFTFVHSFDSSIYPRCLIMLRYYFSRYVTVHC